MSDGPKKEHSVKSDWQSKENAAAYKLSRTPKHFKRFYLEQSILESWIVDLPAGAVILDAPCGTGRWIPLLLSRNCHYVGGDFALAMIDEARREPSTTKALGFVNLDVERLPFADNSVDCLIIWRFLHHVPNERTRLNILREAARITRDRVVLSFHNSLSFTYARKAVERIVFRQKLHGQEITHWRLRREAESCGLRIAGMKSFRKYISTNWFACLEK